MRPQGETEEAESPFADLLDSCAISDPDSPEDNPKAAQGATTGNAPAEAKPAADKPAEPEIVQANTDGDGKEEISAELLLLLALGGQPAPEGKEEKPDTGIVSGESAAPDADGSQPQGDSSDAPDVAAAQPTSIPVVAALAAAVPAPSEVAVEPTFTPESTDIKAPAAVNISGQANIGAADAEEATPSVDATETAIAAPAGDKDKAASPEKPARVAIEATPTPTPAETRPDTETSSKTEVLKADAPEQAASTALKDSTAAPKAPHGEVETSQAKPKMAATQPLPDAGANTPTPPAPLQTSAGPHQVTQPVAVQPNPTADHVPISGLAVEIAAHAQAGKNHFEIRLDPPELGRIDVRLDIGSDGQVTSHLRVERAETLDLLRRDAPTLERALQQAGLKTSDNGLQFSLRDQSFSWQQQQGREMPDMARIVMPDETLPSAETQRHYGRLAGLGSGIDIRV